MAKSQIPKTLEAYCKGRCQDTQTFDFEGLQQLRQEREFLVLYTCQTCQTTRTFFRVRDGEIIKDCRRTA